MPKICKESDFIEVCDAFLGEPHGAFPAGTKVVKIKGDVEDVHPLGARGVICRSAYHPEVCQIGYLIDWEDGIAGLVVGEKLARLAEE